MLGLTKSLGVDIGDTAIRVVELRIAGSGYELLHATEIALPDDRSPESLAATLAAALREFGVLRSRVIGALPTSGCALKTASLPPANPTELAHVAKFEAESQLPLPLDELVWGYTLTPDPTTRRPHAVITGARQALVEERLELFQQAGALPAGLLVAPLAVAGTLRRAGRYLLVLADTEWCDLCLVDGDRVLGCRSILAGYPGDEGWARRITREARPWTAGADRPQEIVLLGNISAEAADIFGHATKLPVTVGDPWQEVRDSAGRRHELSSPPGAYAVAVGLAKAALGRKPVLNLLPLHVTQAHRQQRKLSWTIAGLAVLSALLIPVTLFGWRMRQQQQVAVLAVQAEMHQLKQSAVKAPGYDVLTAQRAVTAAGRPDDHPLELLRLMSDKLPPGIALTDFMYQRGKSVVLKGRAESNAVLAAAMSTLTSLTGIDRVMLDHANLETDETGKERGYVFQFTCVLPASADPTVAPAHAGKAAVNTRKGGVVR